jgi:decaprenylphospho-beta-D-erythro-pentofuranosid-2-ulose 2-reductase
MKMLIFGATSAIAEAVARQVARVHGELYLVGRNPETLDMIAQDLIVRGARKVGKESGDLTYREKYADWIDSASHFMKGIDVILIAHGVLGDQKELEQNNDLAFDHFNTNLMSAALLAEAAGHYFERAKRGVIAVIGSVAGDRGRQSNYYYGSAKGGLEIFLQGLRNRLYPHGVSVLTIKPGFVSTPMTAHLKKNFLFASPDRVASGILHAIKKEKDVVYLPWFWKWVLCVIKSIPEGVFKRLKL